MISAFWSKWGEANLFSLTSPEPRSTIYKLWSLLLPLLLQFFEVSGAKWLCSLSHGPQNADLRSSLAFWGRRGEAILLSLMAPKRRSTIFFFFSLTLLFSPSHGEGKDFRIISSLNGQVPLQYQSVHDMWPNKGCLSQYIWVKGVYYSKYTMNKIHVYLLIHPFSNIVSHYELRLTWYPIHSNWRLCELKGKGLTFFLFLCFLFFPKYPYWVWDILLRGDKLQH